MPIWSRQVHTVLGVPGLSLSLQHPWRQRRLLVAVVRVPRVGQGHKPGTRQRPLRLCPCRRSAPCLASPRLPIAPYVVGPRFGLRF